MQRFYVPDVGAGPVVRFEAEQARQLATVLRARAGQRVLVFDGSGLELEVELTTLRKDVAEGRVINRRPGRGEPRTDVTLFQSVLKGDRLDWVVQKAVEVGVARIVPVMTARCVAGELSPARRARLQRIAQEAAEQSGRSRVPAVAEPVGVREAVARLSIPALIPWEQEHDRSLGEALSRIRGLGGNAVGLFIGPEGGFEAAEVDLAAAAGVRPVTLGERVLRAETAAIVALTLSLEQDGALR